MLASLLWPKRLDVPYAEIDTALTIDANGIRSCGHAGLSAG